jgi:hypothetical protein
MPARLDEPLRRSVTVMKTAKSIIGGKIVVAIAPGNEP